MAIFTRHYYFSFFLLLLALLSSFQIHARETQYFFNKIPSNNNNYAANTEQQEPNFIPENQNLGLEQPYYTNNNNIPYKTEDVPNKKYLPRNYNPVSYVTVPEDNNNEDSKFTTTTDNNRYYGGGAGNYYGGGGQEESYPTTTTNVANNNNNAYNHYNAEGNRVQQMGMSDTRFLENGKYYYDTNTEKYARHPLENAGINLEDFRKQFDNSNNFVQSNNYQNDEQFQDEEEEMP